MDERGYIATPKRSNQSARGFRRAAYRGRMELKDSGAGDVAVGIGLVAVAFALMRIAGA